MEVDNATISHILQLQEAAKQNRLVIFAGAGVSASAGVPAWRELVNMFKAEIPDDMFDQNDILKSAQIYRELRGDVEYIKQVKKILKYGQASCNQIHKAIMDLNPCHIVTTNYDDLLEQSALKNNKQYYVVAKDSHLPANQGERMLVKMHGDFKEGNIVLTENDYFDYSRNFPLIRSFLLSLFSTKVVLFVGFSFDDINLKYILREVSSILESKMQRVYMLVDDTNSPLAYCYFQKKGIQILSIPSQMSRRLLDEQKVEYDLTDLNHEKSKALFQSLILIKNYDSSSKDVVLKAVEFLKNYDDQIRFWGVYLKYMFASNERQGFYISQNHLTLPLCYKDWFEENIKNADVVVLKKKYQGVLDWLLDKLQDNRIVKVNGRSVYDEARADIYDKHREKCALNIIHSLAVSDIEDRVKELRKRINNYTIDDLELPYILFKIGRYREAYNIYRQLAPEFWSRRKYILYFISLHNIKALFGKILNDEIGTRDFDLPAFQKENEGINLRDILEETPLEEPVKELMERLVDGKMLMDDWIEAARLNDKISEQRRSAERGGSSINSNISCLLDKFEQTFYFCNENYILNECYKYSKDAYKMMIKGILNSIMTPDNEEHWQTKLEKLVYSNVLLFVLMVDSSELQKIFKKTVTKPIPANDDFINTLSLLIGNLVEDVEGKHRTDYINPSIIADYVKNIILILNRIENAPVAIGIYKLVIHYWFAGRFIEFATELEKLFGRQKPTAEEALQILKFSLQSPTLQHTRGAESFIANMAYFASQGGKVLEKIVDIKQLDFIEDIKLRGAYLLALSDEVRSNLINDIRSKVDNLYDLCIIEVNSNLHIIDSELIVKLKNNITKEDHVYLWTGEVACNLLHQMSTKEQYKDLQTGLSELSKINECYRFLSDSLNYDKPDLITPSWLMQVDDNTLKTLLDNKTVRRIAMEYCNQEKWNTSFKETLWKLLQG